MQMDTNKDGHISIDELKNGLWTHSAKLVNHVIDFDELFTALDKD